MVTSLVSKRVLAAFAAGALALTLAVLMGSGNASAGNEATVALAATPSSAAPGAEVVVAINITPASGKTVAGLVADVTYPEASLTVKSCKPASLCNSTAAPGTVSFALFNAGGMEANAGSVTFTIANSATGSVAVGLTVKDCTDDLNAHITCPGTGTSITIAGATTPSPTAGPTASGGATGSATAAATTAAALPKTGGPSSDSSFQLGWLAAAAGMLIVVAAGAWTLARAREDS